MTNSKINISAIATMSDSFYESYGAVPVDNLTPIKFAAEDQKAHAEAQAIIALVNEAIERGNPLALTGGFVYERKGYFSVDSLHGKRNTSYGSKTDDVVLQLTVRLTSGVADAVIRATREAREVEEAQALAAKKRSLDEQIAELQRQREALEN